ncbi:MAG: hypothetical protein A2W93_08935 [Bacteroidetes bacterium GWF2_43_63]|nr:MAG: hypothetical protein A2W94_02860 [Bacteroidetes bacterium GWE2_42_42]OFY55250.1 MAG: hypothetical protein A2W93_08935 [Bacteroidetes bacterium GWF2_43_63]HBG70867.1 hypothetical protein [Bacteroidales bacterium]HCB63369.1 hypothetical protein [Bacteroidales bacterium]HCY23072.1 hypothetical protein [Bacteroidales bacterium]
MKPVYKILILSLVIIAVLVLLKLSKDNFKKQKISQVNIIINTQGGPELVTEEEVRGLISQGYDSLTKRQVGEIDLEWIENITRTNPYVLTADAFINIDASLTVDILQRKPILRVFNQKNESFFIDSEGKMLPLNRGASPGLIVAAGNIQERFLPSQSYQHFDSVTYDQTRVLTTMHKVFLIAAEISKDTFLTRLITQIYVVDNAHYELIPVIGNQNIILGDVDGLRIKLRNLHHFYKKGYSTINFNKYKSFDIRFHNQVVAIKKVYETNETKKENDI